MSADANLPPRELRTVEEWNSMAENTVCSICGRDIIHLPVATGGTVACDPAKVLVSDLEEGVSPFPTLITAEGHPLRAGFAYPGSAASGHRPHFYTCDTVEKEFAPALRMDRAYAAGDPSVGPATGGEGGGGELP